MSQLEKLKDAFRACRGPYPFDRFERMLKLMGYDHVARGKTGGSRRKMFNETTGHLIVFHEPHDNEMGAGTVNAIRSDLIEKGLL